MKLQRPIDYFVKDRGGKVERRTVGNTDDYTVDNQKLISLVRQKKKVWREPRESIAKKQRMLQRFKEDLRQRHEKEKGEEIRVSTDSSVDSEYMGKVDELRDMNV